MRTIEGMLVITCEPVVGLWEREGRGINKMGKMLEYDYLNLSADIKCSNGEENSIAVTITGNSFLFTEQADQLRFEVAFKKFVKGFYPSSVVIKFVGG